MPYQLAELKKLHELDWRDTPMADRLLEKNKIATGDLTALMSLFDYYLTQEKLKNDLFEKLIGEHYVREVDNAGTIPAIKDLVEVKYLR